MTEKISMTAGKTLPLGSFYDGQGVNFAVFSSSAQQVYLCLFDNKGKEQRIPMQKTDSVWHIYISGLKPHQLYGYRADGEYNPSQGKKFNVNKLIADPYAKSVKGKPFWHTSMFSYSGDFNTINTEDSAPFMIKSEVTDDTKPFDWQGDVRPLIPFDKTILYETHVKGLTKLRTDIPSEYRGKFLGLCAKPMLEYFKKLGITSLSLMPVHNFFTNAFQQEKGLSNYWGYDSLCFFAPHTEYLVNGDYQEFKEMVRALHKEGLEIILDVVYNHTTESNAYGPVLCYKGLDNEVYYKLNPDDKNTYLDDTGCGASFNLENEVVRDLVLDSLVYWAEEMHVDGFRFDLAASLGKENGVFNPNAKFLESIKQHPSLNKLKLIAEPWALGAGGYNLSCFGYPFMEWNDRYRDAMRKFWAGWQGITSEVTARICASKDLFVNRPLYSSINFITAHDGFTLYDLVSYNYKHNEINGENNQDGNCNNLSWNSGTDGDTDDIVVNNLRFRRMSAMWSCLFSSAGTPMFPCGDEFAKSQKGNNNAYCQDNKINWLDWRYLEHKKYAKMFNFVKSLIAFRKEYPLLNSENSKRRFYTPSAQEMTAEDWNKPFARTLSFTISDEKDTLFIIMNAFSESIKWTLPNTIKEKKWSLCFDSSDLAFTEKQKFYTEYAAESFSVAVFKLCHNDDKP